ncbi:MAG: hypothetical protein RDV48_00280 [Candidatus Eremiobacteraeota bacterium]|nr:hypothetical protein [Candidatus Eremiobacteraeota bacterium]
MRLSLARIRFLRGLSLVETTVAVAVFMGILVTVILIHHSSATAFQKTQVEGNTYRMAMLAVEQVKTELHGSVVSDVKSDEITYQVPNVSGGHVEVDSSGYIIYDADEAKLTSQASGGNRYLVRIWKGETKRLACIGNGGAVAFSKPEERMLEVVVTAAVTGQGTKEKESTYKAAERFFLSNQLH